MVNSECFSKANWLNPCFFVFSRIKLESLWIQRLFIFRDAVQSLQGQLFVFGEVLYQLGYKLSGVFFITISEELCNILKVGV